MLMKLPQPKKYEKVYSDPIFLLGINLEQLLYPMTNLVSALSLSVHPTPILMILPSVNMVIAGNAGGHCPLSFLWLTDDHPSNISDSVRMSGGAPYFTCRKGLLYQDIDPEWLSSKNLVLCGSCDIPLIPPYL